MTDAKLDRACAIFEIRPSAKPAEIKKRYRRLARRWHPDRFANDPVRQAEATRRMQEINEAYHVLTESPPPPEPTARPAPPPPPPQPQAWTAPGRMSQAEIDAIAAAIRIMDRQQRTWSPPSPSQVLSLLAALGSYCSAVRYFSGARGVELLIATFILLPLGVGAFLLPLLLAWCGTGTARAAGWGALLLPLLLLLG
jgi:DnaJ-like protein